MDLILVVLYKQTVSESATLQSLINCINETSDKHLFVWDNSPYALEKTDVFYLKKFYCKFTYFHSKSNTSLSQLYNKVIRDINFKKIFIFDQDTTITANYFIKVEHAASTMKNIGVFLPFVKISNRIVSPIFYKVINLKRESTIAPGISIAKNRTAFASGLCIKEWVFKRELIWFDEQLSFYGVDYKFMLDYGDRIKHFYVIDYELKHSLSFTEQESKEIKVRRFDSSILSSFYLAKNRFNFFERFILLIRALILSFKMTIKFQSVIFFNILIRNINILFKEDK